MLKSSNLGRPDVTQIRNSNKSMSSSKDNQHHSNQNENIFLSKENQRLKQEIQDLREVITMNKVQIDILSRLHGAGGVTPRHRLPQQNKQKQIPTSQQDKKLLDLVYKYRIAYQDLRTKVSQLRSLLQQKAEQNLVLQQVNQQTIRQNKAVEQFYQKNTEILKQNVRDLESQLQQNQRAMKQYDGMTGFVERNRDIFTPTQQAIQFRNHEIQWGQQIHIVKQKLSQAKKAEENLIIANTLLRNKVVSLQAKLAMPNRNLGEILDKSLKRLMVYFIETQKKILAGDDSDSSDDQDLQLIAPQIHGLFPQKDLKKLKNNGVNIPHLDLLKVRQSMLNGNQKIQQELRRRNHLSKDQRIQRLEIQLQYTRRQLSKNIIQIREQKDKRKRYQRFCQELASRNEQLVFSNQQYQKKLKKCLKQIESNKEKVLAFIRNSSLQQNQRSFTQDTSIVGKQKNQTTKHSGLNPFNELSFINRDFNLNLDSSVSYNNPGQLRFGFKNKQREGAMQQKVENQKRQIPIYLLGDPKLQFKIHMEIMQKELQQNEKLSKIRQNGNNMKKVNENEPRTMKRSTSDPFLYFNERRQQIMQVNQQQLGNNVEQGYRLQQTQYPVPKIMQGWARGADQDLDDVQI